MLKSGKFETYEKMMHEASRGDYIQTKYNPLRGLTEC